MFSINSRKKLSCIGRRYLIKLDRKLNLNSLFRAKDYYSLTVRLKNKDKFIKFENYLIKSKCASILSTCAYKLKLTEESQLPFNKDF